MRFFTFITCIIVSFAPLAANAQDAEFCQNLGQLAETVMEKRQSGVTQSEMATAVWNLEIETRDMLLALITGAFDRRKYANKVRQGQAIRRFGNDVRAQCVKSLNKKTKQQF